MLVRFVAQFSVRATPTVAPTSPVTKQPKRPIEIPVLHRPAIRPPVQFAQQSARATHIPGPGRPDRFTRGIKDLASAYCLAVLNRTGVNCLPGLVVSQ